MNQARIAAAFIVLSLASLACNTAMSLLRELAGQPRSTPTAVVQGTPLPPTPIFTAPDDPYPGPAGIGDPYFETLGNGGYNVVHYDLAMNVDLQANFIDAIANITLVATQTLSSLNIELAGLTVDALFVDGAAAQYQRRGVELTIYLPELVQDGQTLEILIEYSGNPGEDTAEMEFSEGWTHYGHGILVAGEPTGASTWYPVNEHPLDKATYSYAITVDNPYQVAANGVLQSVEDHGERSTYYWLMDDPIAPYLTTLAIGEFDLVTETTEGGIVIRNYFGAGVPSAVRQDFSRQGEMLEYFESVFGPYPYDVYGVVVHDQSLGFALETATLSIFGESFTDEYVVAHELAHMWFGDSVGLSSWQDIWLNEGFATYASELWNEHAYGRQRMDDNIAYSYRQLAQYDEFIDDVPLADPGVDYLFYSPVVYDRGSLALHALRLVIGDEAFFDTLRTYTSRFAHSNATTEDFIAVAQEVSGRDLRFFFRAWLYDLALPDIPQMGLFRSDFE